MTKPLPFTELGLRRVIAAVRKEGASFAIRIEPDGAITMFQQQQAIAPPAAPKQDDPAATYWRDA